MVSPADQPDPYKQDAENQPTIQPLIGRNGGDSDSSLSETVPVKKRRLSRAPKACLSCRTRKRKCGGVQPIPCQFCVESNLTCEWPSLDGRASRTRRDPKGISVLSDGISARGSLNTGMQPADSGDWALAGDWLDNLDVLQDPLSHLVPLEQATNVSAQVSSSIVPAMTCDATFFSRLDAQRQVANFIPQDIFPPDFQWSPDFDPASLFFALSSQIPMVEEGSQHGMSPSQQYSVTSEFDPFTTALPRSRPDQQGEKTVKLIWWRPHGHTAIAPGLKRITLKVRVEKPSTRDATIPAPRSIEDIPSEVVDPDGMPKVAIMKHLLHLFMLHFGCQFPSLDRGQLEMDMELKRGSIFLLNSIAATASRFSDHPDIALPGLERHSYGNVFLKVARGLVGQMLSVPSRETVIAFTLLAGLGHGIDSESEEWMMTGMAVRMAVDLGLHLDPAEQSSIPPVERRLNRLTFWSVCLLDFSLSFGTGRETTFRVSSITQSLPSDHDMTDPNAANNSAPSPFPWAARQMFSYGALINVLNGPHDKDGIWLKEAQAAIQNAVTLYNSLPTNMQWSASNLQEQSRAHQASIFLQMHLWMHTIIASAYLTDTDIRRPMGTSRTMTSMSGTVTPSSLVASNLWHNSARTIGDILVLSDIVDPFAYHALPFVNQAFFVAGSCYIKEVEQQQERNSAGSSLRSINGIDVGHPLTEEKKRETDLFRALLKTVASNNISTLQQGLAKQAVYWSGVAWVAQALEQRLSGVAAGAIDLGMVTENLTSFVSVPDAGVLGCGKFEPGLSSSSASEGTIS